MHQTLAAQVFKSDGIARNHLAVAEEKAANLQDWVSVTTLSPPLPLSSTWFFFGELEDTDGGAPTSFSTLEGVSAQPCQCPLGSVASILVYADVRLRVPMTHNNKRPADKVATKFHLSKPVFKIGEDVVGWFDFSGTTASCYQVTVRNTTLPAF